MTLNEKQQIVLDTFINKRMCFVNASAGTGKTTTLIQSYIALLERGEKTENIVVITFTKAAANEMLIRIRSEVRKKIKESSSAYKKEYWNNVYNSILTSSNITTIHAFAQKIVSENALYLGIPSAIKILEEDNDFIENIYHIIDKLLEKSENGRVLYSLYNLYMIEKRTTFIQNIVSFINSIKPRLESIEAFEDKIYSTIKEEYNYNDIIKELSNCDINFCINYANPTFNAKIEMSKPLLSKFKNLFDNFINVDIDSVDTESIKEYYNASHTLSSFSVGNVKADFKEEYNKIKILVSKLKISLEPLCFKKEINAFISFIKEAYKKIENIKKQSGIYTHDDIISIAIDSLENENIAPKIRENVSSLILDEAQDTSNLQFNFINLLIFGKRNITEKDISSIGDKRLFIVGDRKQSIYRFRNADIEQFLNIEEKLKNYSTVLKDNYRSNNNLIDFFNSFFQTHVFSNDLIKYSENDNLISHKTGNEKSINFLTLNKNTRDGEKIKAEEGRNIEANALASYIENNFKNEYKDTTILLRGFSNIHVYLLALSKYNIPFYVEGGRGFYQREEIKDIMNFLYYLFLFEKDLLDLLLTLPFFDISIDDLFIFKNVLSKANLGINDYISIHRENTIEANNALNVALSMPFYNKLESIKTIINNLERTAYSSKIDDVIESICNSTNYYSYIAKMVDAEMCLSNIDKLKMLAKDYEHATGKTAYDFVSHVKRQNNDTDTPLSQVAKLDIDCLRVMTIHKSKGLEFKNTFFASVGAGRNNSKQSFYFVDDKPVITLPVSKTDKIVFPCLNEEDVKIKEESERRRLLYVALTRASDKLVISGEGNKSSYREIFDSFFGLPDFMETNITSLSEETLGVNKCDNNNPMADIYIYGRGLEKTKNKKEDKIEIKETDINETKENILRKKININLASSNKMSNFEYMYNLDSLIDSKAVFTDEGYEDNISESYEDKNIKPSPADVGATIHSILENFDFDNYRVNKDEYINSLLEEGVLDFNGYDKVYIKKLIGSAINNYLKDTHIINIMNGYEDIVMREHSFQKSYKDEYGNINIMKGKIDLITKDKDNNYHIIDYKVANKNNSNESHYKKQLEIYKELVSDSCNIDKTKLSTYLMYLK